MRRKMRRSEDSVNIWVLRFLRFLEGLTTEGRNNLRFIGKIKG